MRYGAAPCKGLRAEAYTSPIPHRSLLQANNGALENLFAWIWNNGAEIRAAVGYGGVE